HHVDQLVKGALVGERIPPVAVVQRQAIPARAERSETEAWIGTVSIDAAQHQVTTPGFDRHTACSLAMIQQTLDGRHDRRQPGCIWATLGWGLLGSLPPTNARPERRLDRSVDRDLPASLGSRVRSAAQELCMPGPAATLELTAPEVRQLTALVRAGTT